MLMRQHSKYGHRPITRQTGMKRIYVLLVLALLAGHSVTASYGAIDTAGIALVKSGVAIKVFYTAKVSRYARVAVLDSKGNRVFHDIVRSRNGFIRSYNVSNLTSGEYVVRVSDSSGVYSHTFEITRPVDVAYRQSD
jgi:hypothetical protein